MQFIFIFILTVAVFFTELLTAQPESLRPDITVSEVLVLPNNTVRIARDPSDGTTYIIRANGRIYSVDLQNGTRTQVYASSDHGISGVTGFAISDESTFFIVSISSQGGSNVATLTRGKVDGPPGCGQRLRNLHPTRAAVCGTTILMR